MKIERFDDRESLDTALVQRLEHALEAGGGVMLSGGNTPRPAYAELGARRPKVHASLRLLYSDERYVPSTSEASNYRASLPLLQGLHLGEDRVLRVRTELAAQEAAADYERSSPDRRPQSASACWGWEPTDTRRHCSAAMTSNGRLAISPSPCNVPTGCRRSR